MEICEYSKKERKQQTRVCKDHIHIPSTSSPVSGPPKFSNKTPIDGCPVASSATSTPPPVGNGIAVEASNLVVIALEVPGVF